MRRWLLMVGMVVAAVAPASASAKVAPVSRPSVPQAQASGTGSVRLRQGAPGRTVNGVPSFDGVSLDVDVTLPPESAGKGPFPTIVMLHGYGNDKTSFESSSPAGNTG